MTASDMRKLRREYIREGWLVEPGGKHWKLRLPGRRDFITIAATPSDHRAIVNIRARARRYQQQGTGT